MMIQSVWKNLTGLQKDKSSNTNDLYIHYKDKSTGTPFFRRETVAKKKLMYLKLYFHLCCNSFEVYERTVSICHLCLVMSFWLI